MDPIEGIDIRKDSSFAILLEAQHRGQVIYYMQPNDLFVREGLACARASQVTVQDNQNQWFNPLDERIISLGDLDLLFMRKDPPVDTDYINATYILELAQTQGTKVINNPQALRDANEKFFITRFPDCTPPLLVSSHIPTLKAFIQSQKEAVVKPLDNKGGTGVVHLSDHDPNTNAILALLTQSGQRHVMAQRFIPEISEGDKRILLVNGDPVPYALLRIPSEDDWRGNLVVGAQCKAQPLTERDRWICNQVGPVLCEKGLLFVGLDVIGDYLTEINVTSPTCIREMYHTCGINIAAQLLDFLTIPEESKSCSSDVS